MSFKETLQYILQFYQIDDLGFCFFIRFLYSIIPSTLFVKIFNFIFNLFSAIFLFYISSFFLKKDNAILGTLIICMSLIYVFYQSSGLKETLMVFIINGTYYFYYKYITNKKISNILFIALMGFLLVFFRPVLFAFIIASIIINEVLFSKIKNYKKILIIIPLFLICIIVYMQFTELFTKFTDLAQNGAEDLALTDVKQSSSIKFIFYSTIVCGIFGPLPTFISNTNINSTLYAGSLFLKSFLSIYFVFGFFWAIRNKNYFIMPILIYTLFETIGLISVLDTFETRKALPHIPFVILIGVYGYEHFKEIAIKFPVSKIAVKFLHVVVAFLTFFWTLLRV